MKNFYKVAKVSLMVFVCALFLGIGIQAEAAEGQVGGLEQTAHGYNRVLVEWTDIEDVAHAGYRVDICENKNFEGDTYAYGYQQGNEVEIGDLAAGKSYYVRVVAATSVNNEWQDLEETASAPFEVVTAPMSKVTKLKQTKAEAKKISLSWKKANGANSYWMYRYKKGATSPGKPVKIKNVSSYNLSGLAADTKYEIEIFAVRKSESGYEATSDSRNYAAAYMSTMPKKVGKVKFLMGGSSRNLGDATSSSDAKQGYFSWPASKAADGYEYTVYGNNGKKLFTGTTTTSNPKLVRIANKKLTNTQFMKIKVKAFIKVNGKKKFGPASDDCWFAKYPPNVKKAMVGRYAADGVRISWKKMTGAKDYTVYVSTSPDSGYKKVSTTSGTSCIIKKCNGAAISTYRNYYYYVQASKKVGGKTIKSDDSWYGSFYITPQYY